MRIVYIFLLSLLVLPLKSQSNTELWQIDFQDHFKNDTISLNIGNCMVIKNFVLVSDESDGLTKLILKSHKEKDKIIISYCDNQIYCNNLDRLFIISIRLNGKEIDFSINLDNGKFIGFSKNGKFNLTLNQSKTPFEYD